jgi:hypothetical protein
MAAAAPQRQMTAMQHHKLGAIPQLAKWAEELAGMVAAAAVWI